MRYLPLLATASLAALTMLPLPAIAEEAHALFRPDAMDWRAGPPTLPPGAELAVLHGNPGAEGLFALRFKFPAGYHIPPHLHPKPEIITVISGTIRLGHGETADAATAETLEAGGLFAMPLEMAHYLWADEETVVQLNSVGPFGISYIDPEDDPRKSN